MRYIALVKNGEERWRQKEKSETKQIDKQTNNEEGMLISVGKWSQYHLKVRFDTGPTKYTEKTQHKNNAQQTWL